MTDPLKTYSHDSLIGKLDLATKVTLLTGATAFTLAPEPAIGLGELRLSDGPTGVRGLKFTGGRTVTLFPNATLLASAWSEATAYEVGQLLAEEAMAQQIHVVLGPTINLHRSLLGGRLFEAYSEDPLLTGKLAAAYVRGLQDSGVGACLKHLIANESETERNSMNSIVDEATLRELYLLPFEIAVEESNAWSMMAAYNDVNGVAATEQNHVNNEIVKGEWGYTGLIMSDWFATKTAAPAANGGLDLVMPGPKGPWGEALIAAVHSGEVAEAVIDDHLRRLLVLAERVGGLGDLRSYPDDLPAPDSEPRKEQLTRLAAAGMTVLTNRGGVLPLTSSQTVALIGRHALDTIDMGGGSAQVNPPYQVSVAEGLSRVLGDNLSVTDGVEVRTRAVPARAGFVTNPESGEPGAEVTLSTEDGTVIQQVHSPTSTMMIGFDDDFDQTVAKIVFRARIGTQGQVQVGGLGAGAWDIRVGEQQFDFQLRSSETGIGAEMLAPPSDSAEADVTAGNDIVEGSVVLRPPVQVGEAAIEAGDEVTASVNPLAGVGLFGLIARPAPVDAEISIAAAVEAARTADVAVVVVGLTEEQETESVDKSTLHLTGRQDDLVGAVAAVAAKTVVVVNSATPVILPWLDGVDAVLWAGLPGQEGGHAVAAALMGEIEPAGRLVTTFPAEDAQTPAWSVTPVNGAVEYTEGTFIGYRGHFAGKAHQPVFWLGHGLGYSTWEYGDAAVRSGGQSPTVSVTVTNTGPRDSRDVVQVYLRPTEADQPVRLVGWRAVPAAAGEKVRVEVLTDPRMWRRWDTEADGWGEPLAGGQLLVARGLGDIRATLEVG
jgi:beta-glucosidase